MKSLRKLLSEGFKNTVEGVFPSMDFPEEIFEVTHNSRPELGDYQFNGALKLAKSVKQSPQQVATLIIQQLSPHPMIASCESSGPGFINIRLNRHELAHRLQIMESDDYLGVEQVHGHPRVVVDFSSPNTAKEMHVGHLRSTIIGDCLARLFEFLGYDVLRLNHIGDWGTAFGMLIAYLKCYEPEVLTAPEHTHLSDLANWYRSSKKLFDSDADFKKRSQQEVVALQAGDPSTLQAWKVICQISRSAYQVVYDLLGIRLLERGESFYNPWLPEVVEDLEKKGLITVSDGAKCIFMEEFDHANGDRFPLIVQKSDGGFNYATTDLAAMRHRVSIEKAKRIIIVTDAGQALHFQMVFKAAEKAGYVNRSEVKLDHVPFGLVLGPDGKKFSTRKGESEKLVDVLLKATEEAEIILKQRRSEWDETLQKQTAQVLGINAIKYADLSCQRLHDYTFSYERMLRFEGNTAAFVCYAYVRVCSILRKVESRYAQGTMVFSLDHESEWSLGLHLARFSETLEALSRDLLPHYLTEYLFELAERFNIFFRDCRVEGDPKEASRFALCRLCERVLRQGLEILGLRTVDKM